MAGKGKGKDQQAQQQAPEHKTDKTGTEPR